MTGPTTVVDGPPESVSEPAPEPTCRACPHPWEEHDPIGVRFCSVTTARELDRGCACGKPK